MQKGQVGAMWKSVLSTWHLNWPNILKLLREWERKKYQVRPLRTFIELLQAIIIEKVESKIQGEFVKWTFPEIGVFKCPAPCWEHQSRAEYYWYLSRDRCNQELAPIVILFSVQGSSLYAVFYRDITKFLSTLNGTANGN